MRFQRSSIRTLNRNGIKVGQCRQAKGTPEIFPHPGKGNLKPEAGEISGPDHANRPVQFAFKASFDKQSQNWIFCKPGQGAAK